MTITRWFSRTNVLVVWLTTHVAVGAFFGLFFFPPQQHQFALEMIMIAHTVRTTAVFIRSLTSAFLILKYERYHTPVNIRTPTISIPQEGVRSPKKTRPPPATFFQDIPRSTNFQIRGADDMITSVYCKLCARIGHTITM